MSIIATQDIFIDTDRGRLFAKRWTPDASDTHRATIVMQHDSLGCVALWRDFPEQLAALTGHAVVAYDRLGFGRSDPHPGHLKNDLVDQEARGDFRIVLDALEIGRFIAFGHSIGGGMSAACAAIHPESCAALITESAQTYAEAHTLEGIRQAKVAFAQPGQLDRLQKYHGDKATWVLEAWTETWLSPQFADWSLDDYLRRVSCPVLALHGDNDEYGTLEHPRRIQALTGATTVILNGCGHIPHREQPEHVAATIRQWLQSVLAEQ